MKKKVIINTSTFVTSKKDMIPNFINSMVESLNSKFDDLELIVLRPMRDYKETPYIENGFKVIPYKYLPFTTHQNLYKYGLKPAYEKNRLNIFKIFSLFVSQFFVLIKIIRNEKPDYIYCQWFIPQAFITALVVKIYPSKFYFSTYGADVLITKNIKFIGKKIVRFVVNSCDKFSAISDLNLSLIKDSFNKNKLNLNKGKVIPLPIDNYFFETKEYKKNFENNFLSIGRLVAVKGIDLLIDSIVKIDVKEDFRLDILGDGVEKAGLEKKVISNKLEGKIFFHGWKDNDEKMQFIKNSDVVLITSIQNKTTMEGGPLTLIEALSQKKIVICSDSVGYSQHIKSGVNGLKFKSGDINSLKETIMIYLNMTNDQKKLISEGGFNLSKLFNQDKITEEIYDHFFND